MRTGGAAWLDCGMAAADAATPQSASERSHDSGCTVDSPVFRIIFVALWVVKVCCNSAVGRLHCSTALHAIHDARELILLSMWCLGTLSISGLV